MKKLRLVLGIYAAVYIIGAVLLYQHREDAGSVVFVVYLLVNAVAITVGLVFEHGRYQTKAGTEESGWQPTGERFTDDSTGKLMEVYYHPKTGARDYRDVSSTT